jgi:hypothetical protein
MNTYVRPQDSISSSKNSSDFEIIHFEINRQKVNKLVSKLMVGFENNSLNMSVPKLTKSNYDNWNI